MITNHDPRTELPSVHEILEDLHSREPYNQIKRDLLKELIQNCLRDIRKSGPIPLPEAYIHQRVSYSLEPYLSGGMKKVLNGTGVILHTNLGRAPLGSEFLDQLKQTTSGYLNLEFDLKTGKRGERGQYLGWLLKSGFGVESALVVNNNAAAVFLTLTSLCKGKKAVVSRGELVEIGGSFRIPEIMSLAGVELIEVGSTNRTRIQDYQEALINHPDIQMFLKVHRSNFKLTGFVEETSSRELYQFAENNGKFFYEDLGSGLISPLQKEPLIKDKLQFPNGILSFSGDKLLGGPQSGIILGPESAIKILKKHPLYRCLRVGKSVLLLLENLFRNYFVFEKGEMNLPVNQFLNLSPEEIEGRVKDFLKNFTPHLNQNSWKLEGVPLEGQAGGGSLPEETLPSFGIKVTHPDFKENEISSFFRNGPLPLIGINRDGGFFLDFRTLVLEKWETLLEQFKALPGWK